jgi:hypothetical protein
VSARATLTLPFQEQRASAPPDVIAGLDLLVRSAPVFRDVGPETWRLMVSHAQDFAETWDARARAAGWSSLQLYGLHRIRPGARLNAAGAVWLAALRARTIIAVDAQVIIMATQTGGRLAARRMPPDPEAVLAWELVP